MKKLTNLNELQAVFAQVPDEAIAFLKSADGSTEDGRREFGENCYINVMSYMSKTEAKLMEAHDVYADVQYIIAGEEKMLYTPRAPLTVEIPYNPDKDCAKYTYTTADEVICRAGEAVIFYPEDGHLPNLAVGESAFVKKAVVKVKL